jgi:hypothetical protein
MTLSISMKCHMLSFAFSYSYAECCYTEYRYAECRGTFNKYSLTLVNMTGSHNDIIFIFATLISKRLLKDSEKVKSITESILIKSFEHFHLMEQHTLKNVSNCLNTNIYSYLEASGGQSSNPYLNVARVFNTRVD